MPKRATVTTANRGRLLTKTGFKNYECCMNPYVGCELGCSYCYVRFFIKDKEHEWGEFVRARHHIEDKLPREIQDGMVPSNNGPVRIWDARLVIGTMTDPYQPIERKHRLTRKTLEILTDPENHQFKKVGIFTRSPIVLDDLELIKRLPAPRIHFTVTPFPPKIIRAIEPFSSMTQRRWDTIAKLKEAGLRVHANISPVIPGLSEGFIEEFVAKLIELQVDEYFVDPMQPYKQSMDAFREACKDQEGINWEQIESIITNKEDYLAWKHDFHQAWDRVRRPLQHQAPDQLPIWSDHENHVWVDMRTGEQMDLKHYGDEAVNQA